MNIIKKFFFLIKKYITSRNKVKQIEEKKGIDNVDKEEFKNFLKYKEEH